MQILYPFHFLRPWWFVALLPVGLLLWEIYRRKDASRAWRGLIADHLLPHLLSDQASHGRMGVIHLLAAGWCVTILSLAGPTWQNEPSPFAEDNAALVIVIKVTSSMRTGDVEPDRLTRSVEKIHDLLASRRGAKTGLIAYAGSAHLVMPITTDEGIIDTFAQALDPKIMPKDGDVAADALQFADKVMADAGTGGSILWITDGIAPEEGAALARWRKSSMTTVRILAPLPSGTELDSLEAGAAAADARLIRLTADNADVTQIVHAARYSTAPSSDVTQQWRESGYWLTPLCALLALPFFRRGWLVPTSATS